MREFHTAGVYSSVFDVNVMVNHNHSMVNHNHSMVNHDHSMVNHSGQP